MRKKQPNTDLSISTKFNLDKARAEAEKLFREQDAIQPASVAEVWKQELQLERQDGVFSYLDKTKRSPHLPVEIMWQIACGKVKVYDPDTCQPILEEDGTELCRFVDTKQRMRAAHVLMEYAYGRPAQDVNIRTENVHHNINYAALPPDKLDEMEKLMREAVKLAELPDDSQTS